MATGDYAKKLDAGTSGGTGGVLFTDRRQFYIDPNVYKELWTSVTPFISGLMSKAGSRRDLADPLFKMFEHANPWQKMEVVNNGDTTTFDADDNGDALTIDAVVGLSQGILSAADNSYVGLVFECWDSTRTTRRGVAVCTAAGSQYTLTLKNLGTSAFTTADNDIWVCIGHLTGEGEVAPEAWADELSVVWNSTGITRVPVEITGTLYQASLRGANKELERLRKQKMEVFKIFQEKNFLRGMSMLGTNMNGSGTFADNWRTNANSRKIRSTMGLITAIETYGTSTATESQNIFDNTAGMTWNQWVDITEKIWQYLPDSGVKDFYCGPRALSYWSKIDAAGKFRTGFDIKLSDMRSDTLGVYFKYIETPFGIGRLIYTPSLKREYSNYMISVTMENLFHAVYRPMQYFTNILTDNHYDGIKDEYFSDEGIGIQQVLSHSIVKLPTT